MAGAKGKDDNPLIVEDEPGMTERFQRTLRKLLNTPPQPRGKAPKSPPTTAPKERPASKRGVHKRKGQR